MKQIFDTKVTFLGNKTWGCRILKDGTPFQEARVHSREDIGPAFRNMLRMLDKCGWGCELASAARRHNSKPGNKICGFKVIYL